MPRTSLAGFSISKLKSLLQSQESKRGELLKERRKVQKQLDKIDKQIAGLMGGSYSGGGGRVRNEKNLVSHLEDVLGKAPKGMSVGDIVDAVKSAGYQTKSD